MTTIEFLFQYIRIVSYVVIILTCLFQLGRVKWSRILFVGDILTAMALFTSLLIKAYAPTINTYITSNYIITPAVAVWALVHVISFFRNES